MRDFYELVSKLIVSKRDYFYETDDILSFSVEEEGKIKIAAEGCDKWSLSNILIDFIVDEEYVTAFLADRMAAIAGCQWEFRQRLQKGEFFELDECIRFSLAKRKPYTNVNWGGLKDLPIWFINCDEKVYRIRFCDIPKYITK